MQEFANLQPFNHTACSPVGIAGGRQGCVMHCLWLLLPERSLLCPSFGLDIVSCCTVLLLQVRLQAPGSPYTSSSAAISAVVAADGIAGLWKGATPGVVSRQAVGTIVDPAVPCGL